MILRYRSKKMRSYFQIVSSKLAVSGTKKYEIARTTYRGNNALLKVPLIFSS